MPGNITQVVAHLSHLEGSLKKKNDPALNRTEIAAAASGTFPALPGVWDVTQRVTSELDAYMRG